MRTRILLPFTLLLFGVNVAALAQVDTLYLTLRDCIRMAQEPGPLGAIAQHQAEAKKSRYASFRA